jgi:hypothetical protein
MTNRNLPPSLQINQFPRNDTTHAHLSQHHSHTDAFPSSQLLPPLSVKLCGNELSTKVLGTRIASVTQMRSIDTASIGSITDTVTLIPLISQS